MLLLLYHSIIVCDMLFIFINNNKNDICTDHNCSFMTIVVKVMLKTMLMKAPSWVPKSQGIE